ncbi:MAG: DnaA N-terminal domain-containing protein [Bacteriovoracia bacterium]
MKKSRPLKRTSFSHEARLGRGFGSTRPIEALKNACPVVKASYLWLTVSDQLLEVLGPEVHHQWFRNVRPVVLTDGTLVLETPTHLAAQWIHCHYQELVDVLLSVHDRQASALFMSQRDRTRSAHIL